MKRATYLYSFFALFLFILSSTLSCETHSGEENKAFENVKTDKMKTGDSATVSADIASHQNLNREDKIKMVDAWSQFKKDIEKRISSNEKEIEEIKAMPLLSSYSFKQVTKLETENFDLRIQMHEYNELDTSKLAKFKTSIISDVDEIKFELLEIKTSEESSSTEDLEETE